MRRIFLFVFVQLLFYSVFSQIGSYPRHLKLISVSGNGYQRGFQHGQQMKTEISELMVLWKNDLQRNMQIPADSFIHQFLANTNFTPAIKKYTPDILEEVRGIAEGSGQSFDDIFAFQLVDEYWVYQDKIKNDTTQHHCSAIGFPAMNGQPAIVSQNIDLDAWMDGYQMVLHIKQNNNTPEQYIVTCAGVVTFSGINEHGIGVCVNSLMQLNASSDGLPVAYVIRGLLLQKNRKEALQFLQSIKHASGQNYIVGAVDSVYDFEASSNKVVRMYTDPAGIIYHTNNPIVNDDIKPWYDNYYQHFLAGKTQNGNSEVRFTTLKTRASQTKNKDDIFIKTTLRSKDDTNNPVCRTHLANKHGFTFGSVIFTLSPKPFMEATAGPPDESEYQSFYFVK